jgi:excinuclease ABC subunit C
MFYPEEVIEKVKKLPNKPGVYQFLNKEAEIIYIGKAKSLKKRVTSYFSNSKQLNSKTKVLVKNIHDLKFTIVDTEVDAFLLENSLIKSHQPKYNINLKDDKTYQSICVKNEAFPRVFSTRKIIKDGSTYFGPYSNGRLVGSLLDLIRNLFFVRTCSLDLSPSKIEEKKYRRCLEYQIGKCKAPCEALQSEEEYNEDINQIKEILKGNINRVVQHLKTQINIAVEQLEFEKAAYWKERLDLMVDYQSKSAVVSNTINNIDVITISDDEKYAFINFMRVNNGMVIITDTIEIKKKLDEEQSELLLVALANFYDKYGTTKEELIVPFELEFFPYTIKLTIPKLGDKKKLQDLSLKNTLFFKKERLDQYEKLNPEAKTERVLNQLKQDLRLADLPVHIECFDNSNLQGTNAVSAMVVFKNAKPSKKDYRHFNVKTVEGPNDFATMEEVVYRRYKRCIDENLELPQLIIIDGGKGQLSSAIKALKKLGIEKKLAVIGIAKRLEEIYFPGDTIPIYINKKSESLRLIQHLRDEAHRFGITHHRSKRMKSAFQNELMQIHGLGKASIEKLLLKYKSVKKISSLSKEELITVITSKQAEAIITYFKTKKAE